ncbi:hypothetical protein GCM10023324_42890 [Streptomyces youssoufiensis]
MTGGGFPSPGHPREDFRLPPGVGGAEGRPIERSTGRIDERSGRIGGFQMRREPGPRCQGWYARDV